MRRKATRSTTHCAGWQRPKRGKPAVMPPSGTACVVATPGAEVEHPRKQSCRGRGLLDDGSVNVLTGRDVFRSLLSSVRSGDRYVLALMELTKDDTLTVPSALKMVHNQITWAMREKSKLQAVINDITSGQAAKFTAEKFNQMLGIGTVERNRLDGSQGFEGARGP